jgi:hypothetical protein
LKDNSGRTPQSYVSSVISGDDRLEDYQRQLMLMEERSRQQRMMYSQDPPRRVVLARILDAHEREAMIKLLAPDSISQQHDKHERE